MAAKGSQRLLAALLLCGLFAPADDGFAKWWPEFQASVAQNDAAAIVRGAQFPLQWELGKIRKIDTKADFVAHFDTYFTADMGRAVATQKPVSIPGDQYMIIWHARGNEYSLYFQARNGSSALSGLSEGPP